MDEARTAIEELAQHLAQQGVNDRRTIALLQDAYAATDACDDAADPRLAKDLLRGPSKTDKRAARAHVMKPTRHDAKRLPGGYEKRHGALVATPRQLSDEQRAAEHVELCAAIDTLQSYVRLCAPGPGFSPLPAEVIEAAREVNRRAGWTWQRALIDQLRGAALDLAAARVGAVVGRGVDGMTPDELALFIIRGATRQGPPPPDELTPDVVATMRTQVGGSPSGRGRGAAKSPETVVAAFEAALAKKMRPR